MGVPARKSGPAGSGARKYQCLKCNKSFSHPGDLKMHDLVHTGEKSEVEASTGIAGFGRGCQESIRGVN